MKMRTAAIDLDLSWYIISLAFISAIILLAPDAHAYTPMNSDVGNFICWVSNNFEGNAGRGIGTIGISVLGVLALLGRVTWTQALIVGVGVAVLFGAPTIITQISAYASDCA